MSTRETTLRDERIKKLKTLQEKGISGHPIHTSDDRQSITDVLAKFPETSVEPVTLDSSATIAGRVRSVRLHGKIAFADIEDESGRMQALIRLGDVPEEQFDLFTKVVDEGDFLEVSGKLTITKTGQRSVAATGWRMLTKSILPIPSEYYGLKDTEQRLRKRYLDLIANPETRELFRKKSIFWQTMRMFLLQAGFMEVDTPILESTTGGAEAEPFVTHHNALDRDFYLRISLELPLKRLLVGGYEKVFEIGRIFRNEGISIEHLQDYTQMEFYWAYADYDDLKVFLREMYQEIIQKTLGTLKHHYQGREIDWSGEWPVVEFYDLFEQYTGVSPDASDEDLRKVAEQKKLDIKDIAGKGRLQDHIYKKLIRPHLIKPQFLVRPPVEMEPLAKRDPEFPGRVQRLQILACGTELGKGFSELNDPLDQRERFEEQMKLREAGDKEAQMIDHDYIEALEYGMPPAAGFGVSQRLFAVLMDIPIRETVFFPPMKDEVKK